GIKEHRVIGIGEGSIEVGRPARNRVLFREALNLLAVAADDDRVNDETIAVGQHDTALFADGQDRPHQVLVVAHASGDAMHDETKAPFRHSYIPSGVTGWLLTQCRRASSSGGAKGRAPF